ncbi:hypothetical protein GALMADRAFT_125361 [Galerina marginata CBS 339.88]|uniref:Ubiquitin-like domain-containing protein n=1 Tax=Galerina marginata (strain CBS 339.88) TaxID=685588 RepID=A0A067SQU4_GALM3|nr:hypothetical protein GALMADRAFT_125361 [Galerina marginata CBS 339.88]
MPKDTHATSSSTRSNDPLFVYKYKNKRVLATRATSYNLALQACRKLFSGIPVDSTVTLHTRDLDLCEGELTEISEESWIEVVGVLKFVTVMVEEKAQVVAVRLPTPETRVTEGKLSINVTYERRSYRMSVTRSTRINKIVAAFEASLGEERDWATLCYNGGRLTLDHAIGQYGVEDGDYIECLRKQCGGKPVIYLFSPSSLEASVKLFLAPQWNLSAIYPVVPIKPRTAQSDEEVSWRVKVHPKGELTELATGLDVAYLFWEARTDATVPASPPPSPLLGESRQKQVEIFNPNDVVINDENSVVIPVEKITPYLDEALCSLGLHTEARTSFITYWLPSMLKHKNIAFRFVPQASYEHAAPLEVLPSPDVVTRVFMVFQGITDEDLPQWSAATSKAEADLSWWREVVGVDLERALDEKLFRVLEWGGMEVLTARS